MPEFRDNNISNHSLGKKEKDYREKINIYAISWSKEQNAKCCNATITKSAQYLIEPITKIKSRVGTILLQFRLKRLHRVPSPDYIYIVCKDIS